MGTFGWYGHATWGWEWWCCYGGHTCSVILETYALYRYLGPGWVNLPGGRDWCFVDDGCHSLIQIFTTLVRHRDSNWDTHTSHRYFELVQTNPPVVKTTTGARINDPCGGLGILPPTLQPLQHVAVSLAKARSPNVGRIHYSKKQKQHMLNIELETSRSADQCPNYQATAACT